MLQNTFYTNRYKNSIFLLLQNAFIHLFLNQNIYNSDFDVIKNNNPIYITLIKLSYFLNFLYYLSV
mgnify:CR=1 FL=1